MLGIRGASASRKFSLLFFFLALEKSSQPTLLLLSQEKFNVIFIIKIVFYMDFEAFLLIISGHSSMARRCGFLQLPL